MKTVLCTNDITMHTCIYSNNIQCTQSITDTSHKGDCELCNINCYIHTIYVHTHIYNVLKSM